MYKSSFLAHLARASRQHPFFSQNVNSANTTALSLVKPKVGLVTERAYFSSWGPNGQTASNSGGSSGPQMALIAISSDDNQPWEKDLGLHRRQFRSIAGVRRYSTGTRTVLTETESSVVHLVGVGAEDDVSGGEPETAIDDRANRPSQLDTEQRSSGPSQSDFDRNLDLLLKDEQYIQVCHLINAQVEAGSELTTTSFNHLFHALNRLDERGESYTAGGTIQGSSCSTNVVLHYYGIMLGKQITPNFRTFKVILSHLVRHRLDVHDQQLVLDANKCFFDTPQNAFLELNRQKLAEAQANDVPSIAMQIFRASVALEDRPYTSELLHGLLASCVPTGMADDAVTIYDYINRTGTSKTVDTYTTLMQTFARSKDLAGAIECYKTWKQECRNLPGHDFFLMYDAMVRCYFASGDVTGGLQFFESAVRERPKTEAIHHINVARCFAEQGLIKEALEYGKKYLKHPIALSDCAGEIVIIAFRHGQYHLARDCFQMVTSVSAFTKKPTAAFHYISSLIVEGQLDEAKSFVRDCVRSEIELRLIHLSLLVSKFFAAGRIADAFEIVQFVGDRRVVWHRKEMTSRKIELFYQFFMLDLLRCNAMDRKTIVLSISVINTLNKSSDATVLLQFLELARKELSLEELSADRDTLGRLCRFVTDFNPVRQPFSESSIEMAEATRRSADIVSWVSDAVVRSDKSPDREAVTAEDRAALLEVARSLELGKIVDALESSLVSRIKASKNVTLKPMPSARVIFRAETDSAVDYRVGAQLLREFGIGGWSRSIEQGRKMTSAKILSIFRSCISSDLPAIQGEVLLKTLDHFGRIQEKDAFEALLEISESLLPKMVVSVEHLPAARAVLYDKAIVLYNDFYDNSTAQKFHDLILDLGYTPSASAYGSFIAKMDERVVKDGATKALALFDEALRLGVRPTEFLFNTVIGRLAKARRNDEALKLFAEMKAMGLNPNGVTYGTIINSCCRVGHTDQAETLLREMESLPRNQNRIAPYNTLIQHFVQTKKDRPKAFYYWDKLVARAIPPTAHSYRLLIEAYGHLEPIDSVAAESVIGLMQANRVKIDTIHIAALISMYGLFLDDLPAARRLFDFWTAGAKPRIIVDNLMYQSIIETYLRAGDLKGMEILLAQMKQRGIPLSAYIANLAIESYGNVQKVDLARSFFDKLPTNGVGHHTHGKEPSTYESMIKAYNAAEMPQKSREILDLLKQQHYPEAIVSRAAGLITNTS